VPRALEKKIGPTKFKHHKVPMTSETLVLDSGLVLSEECFTDLDKLNLLEVVLFGFRLGSIFTTSPINLINNKLNSKVIKIDVKLIISLF